MVREPIVSQTLGRQCCGNKTFHIVPTPELHSEYKASAGILIPFKKFISLLFLSVCVCMVCV